MDKTTSDFLAVILALAFWVFLLFTPLGGEILGFLVRFYEGFAP